MCRCVWTVGLNQQPLYAENLDIYYCKVKRFCIFCLETIKTIEVIDFVLTVSVSLSNLQCLILTGLMALILSFDGHLPGFFIRGLHGDPL